ncbi:helix-turn-helix domain-containing protein [Campylobacter upsaliensis]|nr:helix-turn-helix domain-containing protein [Campylobacter upsaliensis]EAJ3012955.1 helix-turn-helix domain-containing protein [Campylobacter upsaliensis]EAK0492180.1 helix-turn-helix domain-containing protein [Campylobacter upsaliensis]ECP4380240.1 helix-turn-helix domain-containing protein [Campylobacter upsaliensis]EHJ4417098.1 helix-turn-helix domain-containing protein [Campylobacter upsaliensis]
MIFSDDLKYVYLSIEEYCNLKGISKRTFYRRHNKKLESIKINGKNRKIKITISDFVE